MHAIGFIGNRVYEILMNGDINILHISKEEYLAMKHRYDEMLRRRLDMIIEKNLKQYFRENIILEDSRLRRKVKLTEGDLHRGHKTVRESSATILHVMKKVGKYPTFNCICTCCWLIYHPIYNFHQYK